jgi:hypothetical protein
VTDPRRYRVGAKAMDHPLFWREPRTWTSEETEQDHRLACLATSPCRPILAHHRQTRRRRRTSQATHRTRRETARGVRRLAMRRPRPVQRLAATWAMSSRMEGLVILTIPPPLPSLSSTHRPVLGTRAIPPSWTPSNSRERTLRYLPLKVSLSRVCRFPTTTRRSYIIPTLRRGPRQRPTAPTLPQRPIHGTLVSGWDGTDRQRATGHPTNSSLRIRIRHR